MLIQAFLVAMFAIFSVYQSPSAESHIRKLINELPVDSAVRHQLENGARGDGVHYSWMDEMGREGVKRARVQVTISFKRNGRPKNMNIQEIEYYQDYDLKSSPIIDRSRLSEIQKSGLEDSLRRVALERALHGSWLDVPHPRPKPFVGGTTVDIFDDEWIPVGRPLYGA